MTTVVPQNFWPIFDRLGGNLDDFRQAFDADVGVTVGGLLTLSTDQMGVSSLVSKLTIVDSARPGATEERARVIANAKSIQGICRVATWTFGCLSAFTFILCHSVWPFSLFLAGIAYLSRELEAVAFNVQNIYEDAVLRFVSGLSGRMFHEALTTDTCLLRAVLAELVDVDEQPNIESRNFGLNEFGNINANFQV